MPSRISTGDRFRGWQLTRRQTWGLAILAAAAIPSLAWSSESLSFNQDVIPILTRFGCNSGGCHGKLAGQNGFRLSLRGYAPEDDYESITRESLGRRVFASAPERSLLIRKAMGAVPHGGGPRFAMDSQAARDLITWVSQGMPGPEYDEPGLERLHVSPEQATVTVGATIPLQITATYADGRERDVTWLTRFDSSDPATVDVTESGLVTVKQAGETVVRATFGGLIQIVTVTIPRDRDVDAHQYAERDNAVDDPVFDKLAALRIDPSPRCDDLTFLRRASLDAIGTLPTPEEIRAFADDGRTDKRQRLVDNLLERPEFVDHWTHWFADLLQNRRERDHDVRGVKGVRSFHAWLRTQVAANRPWDQIAADVLTATGSCTEQPPVGYFVVTVGENEAEKSDVADSVAQAFLGTRIGCARCHNHPLEKYTQDDYYHFVSFFSRVALERRQPEQGPTELVVGTRHLLNLRKQHREQTSRLSEMQAANAEPAQLEGVQRRIAELEEQMAEAARQPVEVRHPRTGEMLKPQPLDRSRVEIPPGSDPRGALVTWLTAPENESFSSAMVNRLWKHFLGIGLVEPVDDLRATNPPSNRALWEVLNREFIASGFNVKHLMRLIMTSRTYQLTAETTASNFRDRRFYSHFYARRLPAEVLLDAICAATNQPESFAGYPQGMRAVQIPDPFAESYFLTMFGRPARTTACACERADEVTLPQLLHLQNSDELFQKLKSPEGRLVRLLREFPDDGPVIDEIFLATVSRFPSDDERQQVLTYLTESNREEVMQDLFWALLNSSAFTFNR